jgi:UDP-N-acetylglucosamine 3-dehydrogenase
MIATLKAAVIGVGSMGRNHARVYREIPETDLVAVADPVAENAARVARDNLAHAYTDYHQMFAREKPDLVSIVVPTEDHFQVAMDALAAGCHVLVEKPITATVAQGIALIERAEQLALKLVVGHIVRFDSALQELKRRLDAGELGRVFQVRSRRLGPFPARVRDVGVVIDLATHDLDVTSYLTKQYITHVYAETEREIFSSHEDILVGTARLSGGAIGLFDINWLTPTKVRELTVTGEKGMFLVDYLTQDLYYYENQDALAVEWEPMSILRGVTEGRMIRFPVSKAEPLRGELQAFARSVRDDTPVAVRGEDGLAALSAALAMVQSGMEHRPVAVDLWRLPAACTNR